MEIWLKFDDVEAEMRNVGVSEDSFWYNTFNASEIEDQRCEK
jgi:hypothetical protein